jgi:hypothetical protein
MNALEFLEAVQDRVAWIQQHTPDLLERDVMAFDGTLAESVVDVHVEEFLIIRVQQGAL